MQLYAIGYEIPGGRVISARFPLLTTPEEGLKKLREDYSDFEMSASLVCFYDYCEHKSWEDWLRSEYIQLDAPLGFFYMPWHGGWEYSDAYRP